MPPNGKDGSERTKSFTKHIPASMSFTASASPLAVFDVKTAPPSPHGDRFAN